MHRKQIYYKYIHTRLETTKVNATTAQDPNVMITRVFKHLPLALKMNVSEKSFVSDVKNLVREFLFYDKSEYFGHNFK
jgi:hypothetical protein